MIGAAVLCGIDVARRQAPMPTCEAHPSHKASLRNRLEPARIGFVPGVVDIRWAFMWLH
jgi:hypothetical protein